MYVLQLTVKININRIKRVEGRRGGIEEGERVREEGRMERERRDN